MNKLSNIPWHNNGENISIGVIDAATDDISSIQELNIKNAINLCDNYDSENHGIHVTGIINSNSKNIFSKQGFAYKSDIYYVGIAINNLLGIGTIIKALKQLPKVDVINMSFAFEYENEEIKDILFEKYNDGTILCCAYNEQLKYPWSYDCCIAVGKDVLTRNDFVSVVDKNKYDRKTGTSMQTAFVSSIAAMAKSHNRNITKKQFLKQVIGNEHIKLDIDKNILNNNLNEQIILKTIKTKKKEFYGIRSAP